MTAKKEAERQIEGEERGGRQSAQRRARVREMPFLEG